MYSAKDDKEGEEDEKEGKEQVEWGEREMHNCVWWPKIGHTHTLTHKCGTGLPDGGACAFCLLPLSAMALPLPSCTVAFFLSLFFVVVASFLCLSLSLFCCTCCSYFFTRYLWSSWCANF